jgi:hypothetical protein
VISFNRLGNLGHLGNQMFQYATLVSLCEHYETNGCCPLSGSQFARSHIKDCFDLGRIEDRQSTTQNTYTESEFNYCSDIFNLDKTQDWDIIGYFQSEEYFKMHSDKIRKEFSFKKEIKDSSEEKYRKLTKGSTTSLHIRRTDYMALSQVHTTLNDEYWLSSYKQLPDTDQVFVFSDDIEFCKSKFKDDTFFVFSENNTPYEDLCMMSMCDQHIIANSSFSWWAAWLSKGQTVAPSNWFGTEIGHNVYDLYCKDWIIN